MRAFSDGRMLLHEIGDAGTFLKRFLGWFNPGFKNKQGVLIHPCNAIHTIGMRRIIDVVFLNEDRVVCRIDIAIDPWRIVCCRSARFVLELPGGAARQYGFYEGQRVGFES